MLLIRFIGICHLLHSPILILFPYYISTCDFLYIHYFFVIMLSYTYIHGECPISYVCKKILDKTYIAGNKVEYYPEMLTIFSTENQISLYFFITTTLYLSSLFYVIRRSTIAFPYIGFFVTFLYWLFHLR